MAHQWDVTNSHRRSHATFGGVLKALVLGVVVPSVMVFGLLLALGELIMGPMHGIPSEERVSRWFAGERTGDLTAISSGFSTGNDTWWTIGLAILYAIVVLALTRRWWLAIVPLVAITVESSIFVPVTQLTGRARPEVARLDSSPPTSSYPSGHTAASFALYWSLMLLASRIPNPIVRRVLQTIFFWVPFGVGSSRLYRGMHHLSDVLIGACLGIFSAVVTYRAIRRAERA